MGKAIQIERRRRDCIQDDEFNLALLKTAGETSAVTKFLISKDFEEKIFEM